MATKSIRPETLLRLEEKINTNPEAFAEFTANPGDYLTKHGVDVPPEFRSDLEESIKELNLGPKSFDVIAKQKKLGIGIHISITIRF